MALPELKYCTLERAAKLLNCEIWDIFHWWQLGYIDLSIMVNNVHGLFAIQFNDKEFYKKYRKIEKSGDKLEVTNDDKTFLSICNEIYNLSKIYPPKYNFGFSDSKYIFAGEANISGLITFAFRTELPCFGEYLEFEFLDKNAEISFVPINFNSELNQAFISLSQESELLRKIHISNLIITGKDLKNLQNFDSTIPNEKINYPNLDLKVFFQKSGQKPHNLKETIISIARNTKNYYLNDGLDIGLKAIAIKIKNHKEFKDKGLPSAEQMVKWFISAGIATSKTTKTYDFNLILNISNY